MDPEEDPPSLAERNRQILRRTLSLISWLYAVEHALWVPLLFAHLPAGDGPVDRRTLITLMAVHMGLLAAAGWALWKPRATRA